MKKTALMVGLCLTTLMADSLVSTFSVKNIKSCKNVPVKAEGMYTSHTRRNTISLNMDICKDKNGEIKVVTMVSTYDANALHGDKLKSYIANIIKRGIPRDWRGLTDNFKYKVSSLSSLGALYRENKDTAEFRDRYFEEDSPALDGFDTYLKKLISEAKKDNLPDFVTILSIEENDISIKGNEFKAEVLYNVLVQVLDTKSNKYIKKETMLRVQVEGVTDYRKGSLDNLLGLQFTKSFDMDVLLKIPSKNKK